MATAETQHVNINRTSENLYNSSDEEQTEQVPTLLACFFCGCTNGAGQGIGAAGGTRRRREASAVDLSSWAEPRSSRGAFSLEDALAPVVKAYKNFMERVGGDVTLVASSFDDSESDDSGAERHSRGEDSGGNQASPCEESATKTRRKTTDNQVMNISGRSDEDVQSPTNETSGAVVLSPRKTAASNTLQERRSKRFQRHSEVERQLSETDPQMALKYRLKALFRRVAHPKDTYLNSSGSAGGQIVDGEFLLLAKVYVVQCGEEELESFAKNDPASLKHLLPFLLNSLLYGTYDIQREYLQPSDLTRTTSRFGAAERDSIVSGRKEFSSLNHLRHEMRFLQEARLLKLISNYNVTDSYRGAFRLHGKVRRQRLKEARERAAARKAQLEGGTGRIGSTTLSGTIFGERGYMDSLEPFILKQCMRSVEFALHCFWYFQSSLVTGPLELYSRTLRLLLSVEAAVVHHQIPYNIFLQERNGESSGPPTTGTFGVSGQENNNRNMIPGSPGVGNSLDLNESSSHELWNSRMERSSMFHAEIDFIKGLTDISAQLRKIPRESRQEALRRELEKLNAYLPRNVAIPTENRMHRILRVVPEYSVALSTKERCPFLLVYEMEDLGSEGAVSPKKTHHEEESSSHDLWSVEESAHQPRQSESDGVDSDENSFTKKFVITKRLGRESSHQMRRTERAAMKKEAVALAAGGAFENEPNRPEESFNFQPNVNTDGVLSRNLSKPAESGSNTTVAQVTFQNTETQSKTAENEPSWTGMVEIDLQDPSRQNNQPPNTSFSRNDLSSPGEEQTSRKGEDAPDSNAHAAFGEPFAEKEKRLKETSPFSYLRRWRLGSCIVKAHDQLRQEMFATRLIAEFARIYAASGLPLWLRPYNIIATSSDSGIIETVRDSTSLDSIKRNTPNFTTLADFFHRKFGERGSPRQKMALRNFVESMAGYSVVQYLLQIKDRHNGNILIDSEGHIIHIDFGFLLSNSPGGNFEFEKSPFKLSAELVQVMGGIHSSAFRQFRKLCVQGYVECCHHRDKIVLMVDMFYSGNENLPCFTSGRDAVIENLRKRFMPGHTRLQRAQRMMRLIDESIDNWHTRWYDRYQRLFTGIH